MEIFADLEDCKINGGTLPPDVALTASRPDLVLIDRSSNPPHVILAELTVTWDTIQTGQETGSRPGINTCARILGREDSNVQTCHLK